MTLGVQLGLDKPMKSIFQHERGLNYFDRFMRLTQNRIFQITSVSYTFDLIVLWLCQQLRWTSKHRAQYISGISSYGSLHRLPYLYFYNCIYCFVIGALFHIKVFHIRHAPKGYGEAPLPFLESLKKCPKFVHPEVKFTIQNIALRVSRTKCSKIFCCRTFHP